VEGFPLILQASFISCSLSDLIGKVTTSVPPVLSYSVPSYLVSAASLPILRPSIPDTSFPHPLISDKSDEVVLESISNSHSTVTFEPSGMIRIRFRNFRPMVYLGNALSCGHPDALAKLFPVHRYHFQRIPPPVSDQTVPAITSQHCTVGVFLSSPAFYSPKCYSQPHRPLLARASRVRLEDHVQSPRSATVFLTSRPL